MAGKILVVTTVPADGHALADRLRTAAGDADDIRVLAPAAKVGVLAWLANDEDAARAEAHEAADRAAAALPGEATVTIDRTSHATDPADSIDDALRNFDADEIVVVTSPDEESPWLEDETVRAAVERTGLPVRHIEI